MWKKLFILLTLNFCISSCVTDVTNCPYSIDVEDMDEVVSKFTENLYNSKKLERKNPYVASINFSTDKSYECSFERTLFQKKLRSALVKKGQIQITNFKDDSMIMDSRELRMSEEINQKNIAKKGELLPPELNISCSFFQRSKNLLISITITNLSNGILIWSDDQIL